MSKIQKFLRLFSISFLTLVMSVTFLGNSVNAVAGPPPNMTVTINQKGTQLDPTTIQSATFTVVFSQPINVGSFTAADINTSGSTAPGVAVSTITQVAPNNGTTFDVVITATGNGTIVPTIPLSSFAYGAPIVPYAAVGNGAYMAIDNSNNLYLTANPNLLYKVTPAGVVSTFATVGSNPSGVTTDAAGNVYVANLISNTVSKVTPGGAVTLYANTGNAPDSPRFDSLGNLYVVNKTDGTVSKIPPGGGSSSVFASGLGSPNALAVDSSNNVFVVASFPNTVFKITPAGVQSSFATTTNQPTDISIDSLDNLYVSHSPSSQVSKITPAGLVTTLGGFNTIPGGIAFDSQNNAYVTSAGSGTVRMITPAGVISTFASIPSLNGSIVVDSFGNVFVRNSNNTISQVPYNITAGTVSTTGAGNSASTSGDNSVTIMSIPPATTPSVPDMTAATDSGNSNSDNLTNDSTPDFTGTCVSGETVQILVDAVAVAPTQVCTAGGTYTISLSAAQTQGGHNITATATNAGGTSPASAALAIIIDNVAPVVPSCSVTPNPSNNTVAAVITCTGVEIGTTLTIPGTSCTPTPTSATGTVVCTGTSPSSVTSPIVVSDTDVAGNITPLSVPFTIDTTPPAAPPIPDLTTPTDTGNSSSDNITSDNTPDFIISCTAGDTVKLFIDAVAVSPTQLCPAGGTVTFAASTISDGVHTITATATDTATNTSPLSPPLSVTIDTTAPSVLGIPDMTAATDTGVSSTDNITNDTTPDFTGACTTGDTIKLFVDAVAIAPTQVCAAGNYTITPTVAITPGTHNVSGTATDPAGNVSPVSSLLPITIDTTPPIAPTCVAVPNPSNQTLIAVVTCSGVTPGDTVTIPGATCAPSPAIASGVVNCNENTLTSFPGPATIPVTVTDIAGNTTPVTAPYVVDTTAPAILAAPDMTAPTDTGSSNIDNITNDTTPDFTGTCSPTDTIKIYVDSIAILPTQVCPASGIYTITPTVPLTPGLHSITATATDLATNTSPISPAIPVTIDTSTPSAPTINPVKSTDPVVTGTGEPGDTVNLTGATCTNAPVTVSASGTWSCTLASGLPSGTVVSATQTDPAGNVSQPVSTTVYDPAATAVSATPTINPINTLDPVVSGMSVPGAVITLTNATCTNAPVITNASGMWSCKLASTLPVGTVVSATATEQGKTISAPATTKVSDAATTSPSAPVMNPTDGSPITGTGEPGDTVTVKDPTNATVCTAIVAADGTWTCTPVTIPPNGTVLTGTQTDPSGNVSPPATVKVDSMTPPSPTINPIKSTDSVITGSGEPGDFVTLSPLGIVCTNNPVVVDTNGKWSCTLSSTLPTGTVVTATETDPAGNVSAPTTTTVYDPTNTTKSATPTINPVSNVDPVVTGMAVPGSTITILGVVCTNAPVITTGAGMWTCKLASTLPVAMAVSVSATEPGKTVSDPATTKVVDASITSPSAPVVNPTDGSPVSGTGEPGDTVKVTDPTGTVLCTSVVAADGTWSCNPSAIPPNGTVLTVTQTDPQGNMSPPTKVTVDQTMPSAPTINPIKTTDTTITGTGEPGDIVNLSPAVCTNAPVMVMQNGKWSCTLASPLTDGTIVTATLTDPAGNVSGPATTTVYDPTTKSQTPTINPINNMDMVVTGTAVPGATITTSGATCTNAPVVANAAGAWSCTLAATLPVGTVVSATATEPGKTGSTPASTTVSNAANTAPSAPVVNPTDGSPITGTGEPGDVVKVTDPTGVVICTTTVLANGTWSCTPVTTPAEGTILSVTQTDPQGNVSPPTLVKVDQDTPAAPTISPIKNTDTTIAGTGEPGATVNLTNATCTNLPVIVALDGTWSCTIASPLPTGTVVSATLTDPAGGTSPSASTTVYDTSNTSASTPPVVNPVNDLDKVVTGTGIPGATITVTGLPSGTTCTNEPIVVDAAGNWVCKLSTSLPAGTVVTAISTEPGKTPSGKVTQSVAGAGSTAPSAPYVNPTKGFVVTGTGEPGAVITIKDPKANIICSTTVQVDGTWSCTLQPDQPNGAILSVTQTDADGNTSPPVKVKVDRTAPLAPTINPFSSTDTTITGTGEPGDLITVSGVSCTNNPIIVDLSGNWKCILILPIATGLTISVNQTDPAGNVSPTVTLASSDDLDKDGVTDAVEKGAPNNGDGNGDGIKDNLQANVLSVLNAYTSAYITLQLPSSGVCRVVQSYSVNKESQNSKADTSYDYPVGLLNFKIPCSSVATIKQFWYGLDLTKTYVARKFSTVSQNYNTLTNVTQSKSLGALVFDYQIAEGSTFDDSPAGDSFIVDPIGPALPASSTANTGNGFGIYFLFGMTLIMLPIILSKRQLNNSPL